MDNILNGFPFMIVIFGLIICLLILTLSKPMVVFLMFTYVGFIFYETLMFRETEMQGRALSCCLMLIVF